MNQPCSIELLGGIRVRIGERSVMRFRTQKTAALLGYLACFVHRSHPREEIVELLWPDADPRDSRASLRTALSSLRHQLEPPGTPFNSVLVTDRANVGLNPNVVFTDAGRFEEAVESAARAGDGEDRERVLLRAVDLYRGPLMPGIYEEWTLRERDRLEGLYLAALGDLADLAAAKGDLARATEFARRRVDAAPLDEEGRAGLIHLLEASGRPDEARVQRGEMERILRSDAPLRPIFAAVVARGEPAPPSVPPSHDVGDARIPPPPSAPHLPITLTTFFGREDEVARVRSLLCGATRLITLTGPGGAGKTRLAIESARALVGLFGARIWFVPLADIAEAALILDNLLATLGSQPSANRDPLGHAAGILGSEPALVILDNLEQIAEEGADVVWRLIERIPSLALLVTSRNRLDIEGERQIPVAPLPVPDSPESPERLMEFPSVRLYVDRAQAARPDFQVTPENAPAIATLCEKLEGIPLAIELAAAWASVLTPAQMVARMEDRFAFLASRRRGHATRHRTLLNAIEWSYRLLSPELQHFFGRLSVFRGGWSLEAAESVCGEAAQYFLQQLHDRSLVVAEATGAEMRFRLLESLREFGAGVLRASGEEDSVRSKHRDYYLRLAEVESGMPYSSQTAAMATLETEHDNLRAALGFSIDSLTPEAGLRMAVAMTRFWEVRGHLGEGRRWIADLLPAGADAPSALRAKAFNGIGSLAWQQADYGESRAAYEKALTLFREEGDRQGIADSLHGLGVVAEEKADFDEARSCLEESIAIKREMGDKKGLASSLNTLANAVTGPGDYETARELYRESLALTRELGDLRGVSLALNNLAIVAYGQGDYAESKRLLEETLEIKRTIGDLRGISICLNNLGELAWREGDLDSAQALHDEGIALRRQLGDRHGIATSLAQLATLAASRGDFAAAHSLYAESITIRRDLDDRYGVADCLELMARLAARRGEPARAASLFGAAEALRESIPVALAPIELPVHAQEVASVRDRMEQADFARAWEGGREMSMEQAITVALYEDDHPHHAMSSRQSARASVNR